MGHGVWLISVLSREQVEGISGPKESSAFLRRLLSPWWEIGTTD
jgi:hypothetical protein